MSNLKLPTMTFSALFDDTLDDRMLDGKQKTIAYATTAEYVDQDGSTDAYVIIRHHGSVIAEIARGWVYVTNAGYDSATTRQRIHAILTDNKQDYGFLVLGQQQGDQVLSAILYNTTKRRELTRSFYNAHWDFENRTVNLNNADGRGMIEVTL